MTASIFLKEAMPFPIFPGADQILTAPTETLISVKFASFGSYQARIGLDGGQHVHSGIIGSFLRATKEKGERAFQLVSERIAELVRELQKVPLGEVKRPSLSFY